MMKKCFKCNELKLECEFSLNRARTDGLNAQCKECHKLYRRSHYDNNKQKYIDKADAWRRKEKIKFYQWLSQFACVDCGNADMRTFEFDHLYDKSFNISEKIGALKFDSLMNEVSKCDIVCANCHAIRTAERQQFYSFMIE